MRMSVKAAQEASSKAISFVSGYTFLTTGKALELIESSLRRGFTCNFLQTAR